MALLCERGIGSYAVVSWFLTPFSLISAYQHFGGGYRLCLAGLYILPLCTYHACYTVSNLEDDGEYSQL
jgi:hypothetical protein